LRTTLRLSSKCERNLNDSPGKTAWLRGREAKVKMTYPVKQHGFGA